jgi:hypothetical protein
VWLIHESCLYQLLDVELEVDPSGACMRSSILEPELWLYSLEWTLGRLGRPCAIHARAHNKYTHNEEMNIAIPPTSFLSARDEASESDSFRYPLDIFHMIKIFDVIWRCSTGLALSTSNFTGVSPWRPHGLPIR